MTTRRQFFRSLAIGTAALYLRLSPTTVREVAEVQVWQHLEQVYEDLLRRVWESSPFTALLKEDRFL